MLTGTLAGILAGAKAVGGFFVGAANAAFKWAGVIFAYRLGIRRERQKAAEGAVERARQAAEIDETTDGLSDSERDKWLRGG